MSISRIMGGLNADRRSTSLLADPARLELLDLAVVRSMASATSAMTRDRSRGRRCVQRLEEVLILREIGRRTGQVDLFTKASGVANRAAAEAGGESRIFAAARLQQALCALEAAHLSLEPESSDAGVAGTRGAHVAKARLAEAEQVLGCAPGRLNGPGLIRGRLMAADALAAGDRNAMLDAIAMFDEAIVALDARVRATSAGQWQAALARYERADLMIGMGVQLREAGLLHRAARDLDAMLERLDPNYLPLSWSRAQTLRGTALKALGEITAEARLLKEAAQAFQAALDAVPKGHSPLDRARAAHGLGLTLQSAAELAGETSFYASALKAFGRALDELNIAGLPYRAVVAHDRAACLARQAERSGDIAALTRAETAFKAQLTDYAASADPVAWAVVQISLARIYEARAELLGDTGQRANAAFALTEALEVFSDRGLKSLSEIATTALARLRTPVSGR
jgi:tetratricopeptide (TPR) repeat protein